MKRRVQEAPDPVVLDEAKMAWRHQWLTRWAQLTGAGSSVQLDHHYGSLDQRLAALERAIDQAGKRKEAEAFLRGLDPGPVVSRPAWMDSPDNPYSGDVA